MHSTTKTAVNSSPFIKNIKKIKKKLNNRYLVYISVCVYKYQSYKYIFSLILQNYQLSCCCLMNNAEPLAPPMYLILVRWPNSHKGLSWSFSNIFISGHVFLLNPIASQICCILYVLSIYKHAHTHTYIYIYKYYIYIDVYDPKWLCC